MAGREVDEVSVLMARAMENMHLRPVTLESFKVDVLSVDEQLRTICDNVRQHRLDFSNFENDYYESIDYMNDNEFEMESLLVLKRELLQSSMDMILDQIKRSTRAIMSEQFPRNLLSLEAVSLQVFEGLERWKREQQLAANGAPATLSLGCIEQHFRALTHAWQAMCTQLHGISTYAVDGEPTLQQPEILGLLNEFKKRLEDFWLILLSKSFIVETQPPQVIKKSSKFRATVRLLGTAEELSLNKRIVTSERPEPGRLPFVQVQLVTEQLARAIQANEASSETQQRAIVSGFQHITNGREEWQVTRGTEGPAATVDFASLQIPDVRRERRANNSVLDVKMALLFSGTVSTGRLDGGARPRLQQLHAISLPVVVVVHHNQDAHAWATVTWDNQFAAPDRELFHVPAAKPWCEVARAINNKFGSRSRTAKGERYLTPEELTLLGNKYFGGAGWSDSSLVALSQLSRGKNGANQDKTGAPQTFWDWFYAIMVAVEHQKALWVDGLIMGFVSKLDAQRLLASTAPGTFIIRFSDTQIGCISIVYRNHNDAEPFKHLLYNSKDLQYKALALRILGEDKLQTLFPNVMKSVFEKYCDTPALAPEGYERPS